MIKHNRSDTVADDNVKNEIINVVIGIISQECLQEVEVENKRKYDLFANELKIIYKADGIEIIHYAMTWEGVVIKYYPHYLRKLGISNRIEAYIQSLVLKRTLVTSSLEHKRGIKDGYPVEEEAGRAVERLWDRGIMLTSPIKK